MERGSKLIILGFFGIFMGLLLLFLYDKSFRDIILIIVGIITIINGVFNNKGYHNKSFYMGIFSVTTLWGLVLIYIFLSNKFAADIYSFYLFIGLFIFFTIIITRSYIHRRENPKIPWKNE